MDKTTQVAELFAQGLQTICQDPILEMEWLDMLSQLEFAGCRKITKAVRFGAVNTEVLNHIAEEASHAFLLKTLADKLGADKRPWTQCPLTELGWGYFQQLDHQVSALQAANDPYPAVSWVVEQRVLKVYPEYLAATRNPGVRAIVGRILAQEERHGSAFDAAASDPAFRSAALEIEARLWERFVQGLARWATSAGSQSLRAEAVAFSGDSNRYRQSLSTQGA